jgi:polyphosphate kinase 2 (PPK2 family)
MLEMVDLSSKLGKKEHSRAMEGLERRLGELQRQARACGVPVIVVFEGWDAAGKGTLINRLLLSLDSRGFTVHPTNPPTEEEKLRPFLWRFWTKTPERGRIAIFDRSWYGGVLVERVDRLARKKEWQRRYGEINAFERELVDDGCVVVKVFLHISRKEQAKRFRKLRRNRSTAWKVTKEDLKHHRQYKKYAAATEDMLRLTDAVPWNIVAAHNRRFATVRVFTIVSEAIAKAVSRRGGARGSPRKRKSSSARSGAEAGSVLATVDLDRTLSRKQYQKELSAYQKRVADLEHEVYLSRIPVVVVYEGWDAAGKGGNIRRLVQAMDPRGYEVVPVGAPNEVAKAHHYLWRFWMKVPKAGHITIFDRSWYGRVMVERIEGLCTEEEWRRAYAEINETEEQWVNAGTVLVKFWLHISAKEQLRRFRARERDSYKNWKITEEDWRNRKKWESYRRAVDEMLFRTSTTHAPWTIVEAESKLYGRVKALKTVVAAVEKRL